MLSARAFLIVATIFSALPLAGQRESGELRLSVLDESGDPLVAVVSLTSRAAQVARTYETDSQGRILFAALPFGPYQLRVSRAGFAPWDGLLEIRSALPVIRRIQLAVAPLNTTVVVTEGSTLLDREHTGSENHIGHDLLRDRRSALPGRSVLEMVNTQPGWLLEANGVLHPRGSEYDVQYVIDGVPLFDNRSPSFAQSMGVEEFQSMRILTGGYPAEYGRKLGGVIEVATERDPRAGFHGKAVVQGGSFDTETGYFTGQYRGGRTAAGISAEAQKTDRFLDPPTEDNFTNHGFGSGFSGRIERDWRDQDRTRIYVSGRRSGFLVPNERLQQIAGQRQDRTAGEVSGQISHDHIFSPRVLGSLQGRVRDTAARLWSNELSTPIRPDQERGFREGFVAGSLSAGLGAHELKAGAESLFTSLHEDFGYTITAYRLDGLRVFDRDVPPVFRFADRAQGREQAVFVQDRVRWKRFTFSLGLRYDHYRLLVDESAWSPRLGVAWQLPSAGLLLRASYDRIFQTPATENLLLAGSDLVDQFGGEGAFLPLRPARGHFTEAGFSKTLSGQLRLDGTWFRRSIDNFADDSVLLNTGVAFPIAFAHATIEGYEAKLEVPRWGPFSGFVSYSNLTGHGQLPVAGGLFLGDDAAELVGATGTFPITQDQRNTLRARLHTRLGMRAWLAASGRYNSGLPVELEGVTAPIPVLERQYGSEVIARVNFDRERVRPSSALDLSAGIEMLRRERYSVRLQADALNVTDRLNVINFAGLFSGVAIEPRRSFALRLQTEF